jgi:hypothetical protein
MPITVRLLAELIALTVFSSLSQLVDVNHTVIGYAGESGTPDPRSAVVTCC